jgi:hypothetical protein
MDWTAPYLLVALGCYAALELWFVAMMIWPWLTRAGRISVDVLAFSLATHGAEQPFYKDAVGAGTNNELAVDPSVGSGELCVGAGAEHRSVRLRGQSQDERVPREPVPAGEPYAAFGYEFCHREGGQRRAFGEWLPSGSSWFGAQQVREGLAAGEPRELHGERTPHGRGGS